jgi:hypothetical protein
METTKNSLFHSFSLKNRHNWSDSRFAWVYAFVILVAVTLFAIVLKLAGIYESMAWRVVNVLFIFGGQSLMIIDYKKHKDANLGFTRSAFLCIQTGIYFALLFLPTLAFVVGGYPSEQAIIDKKEFYNTNNLTVESIVFVNWIETIATLSVTSFVVPHIIGFVRPSKQ